MTIYFEAVNSNGTVQINDSFFNYAFATKGSVTTVLAAGGYSLGSFADVSYTSPSGSPPIIAFRCSGAQAFVAGLQQSGNTWTWTFCTMAANDPAQALVEYWIFDRPTVSSNFGMQLFDAGGNLLFDALSKYMKILGAFGEGGGYSSGSGNFAVVQSSPSINSGFDGPNAGLYLNYVDYYGCRIAGNTNTQLAWMNSAASYRSSVPIFSSLTQNPFWLVVDISGL